MKIVKKITEKCNCGKETRWIEKIIDYSGKSEIEGKCRYCGTKFKLEKKT